MFYWTKEEFWTSKVDWEFMIYWTTMYEDPGIRKTLECLIMATFLICFWMGENHGDIGITVCAIFVLSAVVNHGDIS